MSDETEAEPRSLLTESEIASIQAGIVAGLAPHIGKLLDRVSRIERAMGLPEFEAMND